MNSNFPEKGPSCWATLLLCAAVCRYKSNQHIACVLKVFGESPAGRENAYLGVELHSGPIYYDFVIQHSREMTHELNEKYIRPSHERDHLHNSE